MYSSYNPIITKSQDVFAQTPLIATAGFKLTKHLHRSRPGRAPLYYALPCLYDVGGFAKLSRLGKFEKIEKGFEMYKHMMSLQQNIHPLVSQFLPTLIYVIRLL